MRAFILSFALAYANEARTTASRVLLGLTVGAVAGWTIGGIA